MNNLFRNHVTKGIGDTPGSSGIDSLKELINNGVTVKHLQF